MQGSDGQFQVLYERRRGVLMNNNRLDVKICDFLDEKSGKKNRVAESIISLIIRCLLVQK